MNTLALQRDLLKLAYKYSQDIEKGNLPGESAYCESSTDGKSFYMGNYYFFYKVPKKECGISFNEFARITPDIENLEKMLSMTCVGIALKDAGLYQETESPKRKIRKFVHEQNGKETAVYLNEKYLKYLKLKDVVLGSVGHLKPVLIFEKDDLFEPIGLIMPINADPEKLKLIEGK